MSRRHRPIERNDIDVETKPSECTTRQMTDVERATYGGANKDYKYRPDYRFKTKEGMMTQRGPGRPRKDSESKLVAKVKADYAEAEKRRDEIQAEISVLTEKLQKNESVRECLSGLLELVDATTTN